MSLQSILKPNNYNLFVNNASFSGISSGQSLLYPVDSGLLPARSIMGGLVASLNTAGNKTITLPPISQVYSGSGGTGPFYLNPSGIAFDSYIVNNTSGYTLTVNSSGGAGDFRINVSGGANTFTIPHDQAVHMHYYLFINSNNEIVGNAYPIGV